MAPIQPGMQERCHGFHTLPKSVGPETPRCGAPVSHTPRTENHVYENAVDVYAPDNNNNNNPRNSLNFSRFWEYAILSLKFILNQHYLDVVKNRLECFLTPDKEGEEAYAVRGTSGPSPC